MSIYNLRVLERDLSEDGKKVRKQGDVPGVYYQKDGKSIPIRISQKEVQLMLGHPLALIRMSLGTKQNLMSVLKEVQRDPVTRKPVHLSFEGVKEGVPFHINLPIKLLYEKDCTWAQSKGIPKLNTTHAHVEVLPKNMPEVLEIDINDLELGACLHIKDVHIPGIKFLEPEQKEILSIVSSKVMVEEETSEATEEAPKLAPANAP